MSRPTAIIAEDEATLRGQLVEQLGQLWPELAIVGEAADGVQALRLLDEHRPDVMFLDIQMPGATGLEVARQASGRCHVVFVTAYDQHAVAAFDQGAVDYVLKPADSERLRVCGKSTRARGLLAPGPIGELAEVTIELDEESTAIGSDTSKRNSLASSLILGIKLGVAVISNVISSIGTSHPSNMVRLLIPCFLRRVQI